MYRSVHKAIAEKDLNRIREIVAAQTRPYDEACLEWTGSFSQGGYPTRGRHPSQVYMHRVLAHAVRGFKGDLKSFPPVHHLCGRPFCLAEDHLVPVTALLNTLEARLRRALTKRIKELEAELKRIDPTNHVLESSFSDELQRTLPAPAETRPERLGQVRRQTERADQLAARRKQIAIARFAQIEQVNELVSKGYTRRAAAEAIGMSRSSLVAWQSRYAQEFGSAEVA